MKRAMFLDPVPWISAALLFGLSWGFGLAASVVIPKLIDLLDHAPRLAMLGLLLFFLSPAFVTAFAHRATNGAMDKRDRNGRAASGTSAWAGALAWLVMWGTGFLAMLVMLVLDPPPPGGALVTVLGAVTRLSARDASTTTHVAVWIAVAATFFAIERGSRKTP